VPGIEVAPGGAAPARSRTGAALQVLAFAVPLAVLLAGAWSRRWTSDDGFINLRIVEQVWAGNGPVWNASERVEAGTSPLWLAVLATVGGLVRFVPIEWVSAGLGIGATLLSVAAALAAARELHRGVLGTPLVPAGALVVAVLPVFWDFSSSGLETGLSFLWIGLSGWALARAASINLTAGRAAATALLIGLGPLVRPDLALVSATMLGALLVLGHGTGWRRTALVVGAAGALPVAYQLFRMAFFVAVVPNTAFAKEGSTSRWGSGWSYGADYVWTWRLWWPAIVAVAVVVPVLRRWSADADRRQLVVVGGVTLGAVLHALYVVRVGGDFMHGRLLLPATFAVLLPWAALPLRRSTGIAVLALVPWALLAIAVWEPPGQPGRAGGPAAGIVDERAYYVAVAGRPNPVSAEDFASTAYADGGRRAAAIADAGRGSLTREIAHPDDRSTWIPLRDPAAPFSVAVDNIGVFGYLAGPDVTVIDVRGLADPVTSRFRLGERGRPGHEKAASDAWVVGRHGAPGAAHADQVDGAAAAAAGEAVGCGQLAAVLDAIKAPLRPSQVAANLALAVRSYGLRFSADPIAARAELCAS